jgi:hypothetical protein
MSTILGIHLVLFEHCMASSMESDVVVFMIHIQLVVVTFALLQPTINPGVIFGYLLKSPFGGDGWICSVTTWKISVVTFGLEH